jgi:NAD(P)-dependent dehydrogenase (short-subunit alcohol dehydrogenase family)
MYGQRSDVSAWWRVLLRGQAAERRTAISRSYGIHTATVTTRSRTHQRRRSQGHFAFTQCLLPALRASAPSRVVNVSSAAHCLLTPPSGLRWETLDQHASCLTASYEPWEAYGMSKLALVLHAAEFQRRSDAGGWGVSAAALHPGAILGTGLKRYVGLGTALRMMSHPALWSFTLFSERPITKTTAQGVATAVFAALDPAFAPGGYYANCAPQPPDYKYLSPLVRDPAVGARLWEASERLAAPGTEAKLP